MCFLHVIAHKNKGILESLTFIDKEIFYLNYFTDIIINIEKD